MNAESTSVMKRCIYGGTVLASCLQKKLGIIGQGITQISVGTFMRFLSKSTVRNSTSGAPSIMKGQCWKAMFQNAEIAAQYLASIKETAFQIRFSICNSHG